MSERFRYVETSLVVRTWRLLVGLVGWFGTVLRQSVFGSAIDDLASTISDSAVIRWARESRLGGWLSTPNGGVTLNLNDSLVGSLVSLPVDGVRSSWLVPRLGRLSRLGTNNAVTTLSFAVVVLTIANIGLLGVTGGLTRFALFSRILLFCVVVVVLRVTLRSG